MKQCLTKCGVAAVLIFSFSLLFQKCGKDGEGMYPISIDTLSTGWQRVYVDTSKYFLDIDFPTSQIGYVCGHGYVGKSTDGGLTWTKFNLPDSLTGQFSYLF